MSRVNDGYFGIVYSKKGGSGKTTLAKLIRKISPYIVGKSAEKLARGDTFPITGHKGSTGIIFDELPKVWRENSKERIKNLASGSDSYEDESKGEDQASIYNGWNCLGLTNNVINFSGGLDDALQDRLVFIETFSVKDKITTLPVNIAELDNKIYLHELMQESVAKYLIARQGDKSKLRARVFKLGCNDTDEFCAKICNSDDLMLEAFGESVNYDNFINKIE